MTLARLMSSYLISDHVPRVRLDPNSTVHGAVDGAEAVELTQEIVRIPSVVGEEGELARALASRMKGMGFDGVYLQDALPTGRTSWVSSSRVGRARRSC